MASALAVFWLRRALFVTGPTSRLLVPPVHAQPTVTTPLRCPSFVVAMHRHVDHWASTIDHATKGNTNLSSLVVVVVAVFVFVSLFQAPGPQSWLCYSPHILIVPLQRGFPSPTPLEFLKLIMCEFSRTRLLHEPLSITCNTRTAACQLASDSCSTCSPHQMSRPLDFTAHQIPFTG